MSLILDALRKSEAQRRRGQLPALSLELPPAPTRPSPARAWWIALPIGVALAAIAIWLVRPDDIPEPPAPTDEVEVVEVVQAVEAVEAVEPAPAVPGEPEPAPVTSPREVDVVAAIPAPAAPSPPPGATGNEPDSQAILALPDLTPAERRALPPLKLSMHLWSEDPARRFVILDGHRLSEGDRAGNAVVERIEPTGVILAADGRRIRLPLP